MFDENLLYQRIQHDFPLHARPYLRTGEAFGLAEHTVLSLLARDVGCGRISRIGAVFAPNTIGASTVAGLAIPVARLERVVERINNDPAISQSHVRDGHRYNLWFVAGARERRQLDGVLAAIAADVGQKPIDLPLEREYRADLGLPLAETLRRLAAWRQSGVIRRFGAILRHRHFGYTHNVMCVWNLPDARVDAIGNRLAHVPYVTMCFRRPRRLPSWQFNLFAMVHARSELELRATLARFSAMNELADAPGAVLRASHCYKQRGTHYGSVMPEF
ncbi:siroheme decarboxylase subunit beta [Cupriavidus agavae]|uniref:siroheme decarboxylase n=1 Tax=Cupriavidus agavae TaxID=1001822 RepID=A0A4Q7S307_9BURK|nr:Lrp/AsnC family transcriptional regulator [Cupriavidus agavae]RZT39550.1 DNA-binding Lrp family transcriptional regulator [Cupriavidus agavae]